MWYMVLAKNEYMYSFVLLVILRNLCPCWFLVLAYVGIILYSINNLMSFLLSWGLRDCPAKLLYHSCYTLVFWVVLFDKSCCILFHVFKNWNIFIWNGSHVVNAYSNCDLLRDKLASSRSSCGQLLFLLMKPVHLFAFVTILTLPAACFKNFDALKASISVHRLTFFFF